MLHAGVNSVIGTALKETKCVGTMKSAILGCYLDEISRCVLTGDDITREHAIAAVSICKRKFKIEDIVLMVALDEAEEGESGIAFTEKGIYYWLEDEGFVADIPYGSIKEIDFDQENVIIITADDKKINLFCGGDIDDKYSRFMYNYIMDLKEEYEEGIRDRFDVTG